MRYRSHRQREMSLGEYIYNGVIVALVLMMVIMLYFVWVQSAETTQFWNRWMDATERGPDEAIQRFLRESRINSNRNPATAPRSKVDAPELPPLPAMAFGDNSFYRPHRPRHPRTFCFVLGTEGTGSTWVSKMLPADYRPPSDPHQGIAATIHDMWGNGPAARVMQARQRLVAHLKQWIPVDANLTVLHVSGPDWDADHYPDIHSLLWPAFYQARLTLAIIVTVRRPARAAAMDHLRLKGSARDIVRSARSTEKRMTLLSQQLQSLAYPDDVCVLNYHRAMLYPREEAVRIGAYLGLGTNKTRQLSENLFRFRQPPVNSTGLLSGTERRFLDSFFDQERCHKWDYLWQRSVLDSLAHAT